METSCAYLQPSVQGRISAQRRRSISATTRLASAPVISRIATPDNSARVRPPSGGMMSPAKFLPLVFPGTDHLACLVVGQTTIILYLCPAARWCQHNRTDHKIDPLWNTFSRNISPATFDGNVREGGRVENEVPAVGPGASDNQDPQLVPLFEHFRVLKHGGRLLCGPGESNSQT